jgi:hypothetical protein
MPGLFEDLCEDPVHYIEAPYDEGFHFSPDELAQVQLAGARKRFDELKGRVSALSRLAEEQGATEIRTLDDLVPLLLPHTAYKSYPISFLERSRFDALTRWLGGLTAVDLGSVDATGVDCIDDWLRLLDAKTELKVTHTFGTTGKLSFIPRTKTQWRNGVILSAHSLRDWRGPNTGPDLLNRHMPLVAPTYRYGFSASGRSTDLMVELYAGGDDNTLFLYPNDYVSADVASLAGRLRAAEAKGERGKLQLPASLLARREAFAQRDRDRPQAMARFLDEAQARFGGQDIFLFGFWPLLSDWAEDALARNVRGVFGKGSVMVTGGGTKGRVFAEGWRERIIDFLGFDRVYDTFGMSEMCAGCSKCDQGNYHFPPVTIPFVLDVETGLPLPRRGRTTGRLAVMDLLVENYWGGLVTGDLVTVGGWDEACGCGRNGPYMEPNIRRFSEVSGGEDKINCAGAPEAHARALDYIIQSAA